MKFLSSFSPGLVSIDLPTSIVQALTGHCPRSVHHPANSFLVLSAAAAAAAAATAACRQTNTTTNMLTEDTDRGAHQEPYADQAPVPSSEQDPSVSFVINASLKSADDTRSSISSDKSDSKPPRSAMRRSSSISKFPQSPRRVRFDFMGEEVLPTSSPQRTAFIAARISSPEPADVEASFTSNLATDPGEDEEEPPPRKVSSSDALRALSRAPLDEDGTVWTVVNSDSEDSATDEVDLTKPDTSPSTSAAPTSPGLEGGTNTIGAWTSAETTISDIMAHSSEKPEDDTTDDEDILSMAKRRAPSSCASRASTLPASSPSQEKVATSAAGGENTGLSNSKRAHLARDETIPFAGSVSDEKEEDMFHFEEDGLESIRSASKYLPEEQEEEEEEEEESDEDHSDDETNIQEASIPVSLYATSPAISIPKPRGTVEEASPEPSISSIINYHSDNIGSYKGRPLMMSILRKPEILNEIRSSVPIKPVVGNVHDQSPTDHLPMDVSAATSFKQRLIIENMMEAAKKRMKNSGLQQP
ncbi:hypothetical protein E4U43_004673 [Claviceps pusilla]|uniref:Uncharacterized protein n=1 Tax=Claviceps pusilla TaxID=123648 RepID=A0A9P7SUJ7_9HYPO|nr:hypothetical protein E4U43_004673 [Claviceps pusilla]